MNVLPGDVLVISDTNVTSKIIRFREWLLRRPKETRQCNHVAIVSHTDAGGTLWAIEGKPSGVGFVQASQYLTSPGLLSNAAQPKTDEQRAAIVAMANAVNERGGNYDWWAIGALAAQVLRVDRLWDRHYLIRDWPEDPSRVPVHVICSSLADLCYESVGLASPGGTHGTRFTTPSIWAEWILKEGWRTT